ncbi:MAG: galactosyltransferase-related protein [Acidobacteriota bacterium]
MNEDLEGSQSATGPRELLQDVTITVPVKIDSPDRARNLRVVTGYLMTRFKASLVIAEEGDAVLSVLDQWRGRFRHISCPSRADGLFWKTRLLNTAAEHASTRWLLSYDADVLVPTAQLSAAVNCLREGAADMIYPYDGTCIDLPSDVSSALEREPRLDLEPSLGTIRTLVGDSGALTCVGGALMMSREKFVACGMENERFAGWGGEDDERNRRLTMLGMRAGRAQGPLYHLHHRVAVPTPAEKAQHQANLAECARIFSMSREELRTEARRGLRPAG